MSTTSTPDSSMQDNDAGDDFHEMMFAKKGCCSWMRCLGSNSSTTSVWWERMRSPDSKNHWWKRGLKKIREWSSDIIADSKWKTFIRRFKKSRSIAYVKQGSFQYDPSSYALNFDDGQGQKSGVDFGYLEFSTRYASIPASAQSSVDFGKGGPAFT